MKKLKTAVAVVEQQTTDVEEFDGFERFADLEEAYADTLKKYRELERPDLRTMTISWAETLVAMLGGDDNRASLQELWPNEDIHRASRKFITARVGVMVGAFPNVSPHSPEVFMSMLFKHISVKRPSCMVLESTCREVEATNEFLSIAKVLAILDKQEKLWDARLSYDHAMVEERAKQIVAALKKRNEAEAQKLKAKGHEDLAAKVLAGEMSAANAWAEVELARYIEQAEQAGYIELAAKVRARSMSPAQANAYVKKMNDEFDEEYHNEDWQKAEARRVEQRKLYEEQQKRERELERERAREERRKNFKPMRWCDMTPEPTEEEMAKAYAEREAEKAKGMAWAEGVLRVYEVCRAAPKPAVEVDDDDDREDDDDES
jgi:hypothetical protein